MPFFHGYLLRNINLIWMPFFFCCPMAMMLRGARDECINCTRIGYHDTVTRASYGLTLFKFVSPIIKNPNTNFQQPLHLSFRFSLFDCVMGLNTTLLWHMFNAASSYINRLKMREMFVGFLKN